MSSSTVPMVSPFSFASGSPFESVATLKRVRSVWMQPVCLPSNKKQRLEVPAIGDDPMAAEDAPLVLRKAKATTADKAARKAREDARIQAEVKAVLDQVVTRVCKVKSNKANMYARQRQAAEEAKRQAAEEAERQAAEAEAEQPGDFDDDHEDMFGEPVEAEQPAVLFAQLCDRVHGACFGLAPADIHSALEPRYCVDGTWDVTEMQSDFALNRYEFVAKMNPVVQNVARAREAAEAEAERVQAEAEAEAAVLAKDAWLRFEGFFDQIFEVVAPKSARALWGPKKDENGKPRPQSPRALDLLKKMWEAGLPKAEACCVKGSNDRTQTGKLKKWLEAKGFKPTKTGNYFYWHCFALKTGPVQQA